MIDCARLHGLLPWRPPRQAPPVRIAPPPYPRAIRAVHPFRFQQPHVILLNGQTVTGPLGEHATSACVTKALSFEVIRRYLLVFGSSMLR